MRGTWCVQFSRAGVWGQSNNTMEAPQPRWSSRYAWAHPTANRQTGVSLAGYITHHCSAVSAALYSEKHRMERPPGYATGAHVLAGCLSDRRSSLTHPHCPVFSKHDWLYVWIWTVSSASTIESTSLNSQHLQIPQNFESLMLPK